MVDETCFTLRGNLKMSQVLKKHPQIRTGMSMVLNRWIITPIEVGWIRPVNSLLNQFTIDRYEHFQPDTPNGPIPSLMRHETFTKLTVNIPPS